MRATQVDSLDRDALCAAAAAVELDSAGPLLDRTTIEALRDQAVLLGSPRAEGWVHILEGSHYRRSGDLPRWASASAQALRLFELEPDTLGEAVALLRLANVWIRLDDMEASRATLTRALELARVHGHRLVEGIALTNLAMTWGLEARAETYAELTNEALAVFSALGEHARCVHVRCNLGGALARMRRLSEATQVYEAAARDVDEQKQPHLQGLILGGLGEIAYREGDTAGGRALLERAVAYLRGRGLGYEALRQQALLVTCQLDAGQYEDALRVLDDMWTRAQAGTFPDLVSGILRNRSDALHALGRDREAFLALTRSIEALEARERDKAARRLSILHDSREAVAGALAQARAEELATVNARLRAALIEREQFAARLQQVALMDALTGALNRHGLQLAVEHLQRNAGAQPPARGVLVIDVDRLKHINDTYGHAEGDQVLVTVVERLQRVISPRDVLARTGGDEFVVVLVDGADHAVQRVAQRVRVELASLPIATQAGMLWVTVSVGTATMADLRDLDEAVRLADRSMYAEKQSNPGRGSRRA